MAALTATLIGVGLAVAAAGTAASIIQGQKSRSEAAKARDAQEKSANEQRAANAQQAAEASRQAAREERVRRARIMQGAANSGGIDSSGELGGTGALATNANVAQGQIAGGYQRGVTIGNYQQQAGNSIFASQQATQSATMFGQVAALGGSIFNAGLGMYSKASKIPGTTAQPA